MRWFWAMIVLLVVVTGVLFAMQPTGVAVPAAEIKPIQAPIQAPIQEPVREPAEDPVQPTIAADVAESVDDNAVATIQIETTSEAEAADLAEGAESDEAVQAPTDASTEEAPDPIAADEATIAVAIEPEDDEPAATELVEAPESPDPEPISAPAEEAIDLAAEVPAPDLGYARRDDGSYVVDDMWIITGSGTDADPFVIDWPILVSAEQGYQPRKGKKDLPGWTELLEGKRVKLNGFLLLPVTSMQADELLVMQNTWDGCCIGMPPTPYDAVEVRLTEKLSTSGGLINYGAIQGTFKTDPYLVNNWLLGLFMIEDAKVVR